MRRTLLAFLLISFSAPVQGQSAPPPQSARQALIEMFLNKTENDFLRHLPEDARRTLIHHGETEDTSNVLRVAAFGKQMVAAGDHLQTFDTGSTILTFDEAGGHEKTEILVEHDSLMGEDDEIELSIHTLKDGELQSLPIVPRLIFTFRQEKEIWRLVEAVAALHVPLTDPDYLKSLRHQQDQDNEAAALNRITMITGAESNYASAHPDRGYACSLLGLFAQDGSDGPSNAGGMDTSTFAKEESNGYRFTMSGCAGTPALKYQITAVPTDPDANQKTFCANQTGPVKFLTSGKPSTCFSQGQPASPPNNVISVD